jgi:acetyl esterase/lipase
MINFEDIPYRTVDGHILEGRLYRPNSPNGKWVVDVHGGAWSSGDRLNNAVIHNDLTANGVGVFALDFRLSDVAQYPIPVQDVSWGVRWFKDNLRALGIHASSIGGLASSSGAQQMGLVALSPDGEDWTPAAPEIGDADSSLDFFVAAWPIFDPLRRYHLMRQIGNDRLIAAHDAYFANEGDMEAGNPHRLLERGAATHQPPMLIIQGTNDENVGHTWQDEFIDLYRSNGGNAEIRKFADQPHTFVTIDPETEASKAAIVAIREFVLSA